MVNQSRKLQQISFLFEKNKYFATLLEYCNLCATLLCVNSSLKISPISSLRIKYASCVVNKNKVIITNILSACKAIVIEF